MRKRPHVALWILLALISGGIIALLLVALSLGLTLLATIPVSPFARAIDGIAFSIDHSVPPPRAECSASFPHTDL